MRPGFRSVWLAAIALTLAKLVPAGAWAEPSLPNASAYLAGCLPERFPAPPPAPSARFSEQSLSPSESDAVLWRVPCAEDPSRSVLMIRMIPTKTIGARVCGGWAVRQNNRVYIVEQVVDAAGSRICGNVHEPVTVAFDFGAFQSGFDPNGAFSLTHGQLQLTPRTVQVPAHEPVLIKRRLTMTLAGIGAGEVILGRNGPRCASGTCTIEVYQDASVPLRAVPGTGWVFAGWGGACSASGRTAEARIVIGGDVACTARFMPPSADPESGWWWAPSEPGRAYSIELRDDRLMIAAYDYRADGSAVWYLGSGSWDGFGLTTTLTEYAGGSKPPAERDSAGTISLAFASSARGTLARSGGKTLAIERYPVGGSASSDDPGTLPAPIKAEAVRLRELKDLVLSKGSQRVIVRLHGTASDGGRLASSLSAAGSAIVSAFGSLPLVVADVTPAGLEALLADPSVAAVHEDARRSTLLAASVPRIRAPYVWSRGHTGAGQTVAVLDTGIDATHPFLGGRVIDEACFSTSIRSHGIMTACPNGADAMFGRGAGRPCADAEATCYHGTHVAGIVAGRGEAFSGVAPEASLMSVQVFRHYPMLYCLGPCIGATDSDIIRGLEYVRDNAQRLNVVAVNLSLGGDAYAGYCDDTPYKPIFDQLRAIGVASVVAAGNGKQTNAVAVPACVSSAIRVGATTALDVLAAFSNAWRLPMIVAPGDGIVSSMPGGGFEALRGTSMAAPHVAGAIAALKTAGPTHVASLERAIASSGVPVVDPRTARLHARLDVTGAYEELLEPETGWWWNAAEPGSGYFIEIRNGVLLMSTHLYRDDGSSAWYVASGTYARGLFQGTLQEYAFGAGGPRLLAERGGVTLRATGFRTATLVLPSGREVPISRFAF